MKQLLCALTLLLSTSLLSQSQDSPCPPSATEGIHIVQPGETLYGISKKYKVSIASLCVWNNIAENAILPKCVTLAVNNVTGRKTDVPSSYSYVGTKSTTSTSFVKSTNKTHVVMDGESLASIADKYGYTVSRLLTMNGMAAPQPIYVNQQLIVSDCICDANVNTNTSTNVNSKDMNNIPQSYSNTQMVRSKTLESADNMNPVNYNWNPNYARVIHIVAQSNVSLKETPQSIGALYGLTAAEVMAMNGLFSNSILAPGTRLQLEDRRQMVNNMNTGIYANVPNSNNIPTEYNSSIPLIRPKVNDDTFGNSGTYGSYMVANNTLMTSEEMSMVNEINMLRSNPASYIPYIQQYIDYLRTNNNTANSIATANELMNELRNMTGLPVLQTHPCLFAVAQKHGEDEKRQGVTDHKGSDGSMPFDRVIRECKDLRDGNENLIGGPSDIRQAILLLLIDEGDQTRSHRRLLLQPDWTYLACYKVGNIGNMPNCWVQQFGK